MKNKTPVNPNYYKGITPDGTEIEILDVVDAFNLNHNRACMLKYIARADSKDNVILACSWPRLANPPQSTVNVATQHVEHNKLLSLLSLRQPKREEA